MGDPALHSKLGASSMYRWSACPGSIRLINLAPEQQSSVWAEEGTQAHTLAEWALGVYRSQFKLPEIDDQAVSLYVDFVINTWAKSGDFYIEKKVSLDWIDPVMFGTCDAIIARPGDELFVIDYKHGEGVLVEVTNNKQALYYALGAAKEYNFNFNKITLVIVQPRADHPDGPVRSWTISVDDLKKFEKELIAAVEKVREEDAQLITGDHCRFCPAAGLCPKLREETFEIVAADFKDLSEVKLPNPEELTEDQLEKVLQSASLIRHWCKEVEGFAYQKAIRGDDIPGYKLVKRRANRKWKNEQEVQDIFKGQADIFEPQTLKSPAKLEKLGLDKGLINSLTETPDTGLTLVKNSDRRVAVNVDPITNDFQLLN